MTCWHVMEGGGHNSPLQRRDRSPWSGQDVLSAPERGACRCRWSAALPVPPLLGRSFCTIRRPSEPVSLASRVWSPLKLYLENFTTTEGTGCHQLPNRDRIKADGHNRVPVFREKRQGPWVPLKNLFLFTCWASYLNGYHLKILYFNRRGGESQASGGKSQVWREAQDWRLRMPGGGGGGSENKQGDCFKSDHNCINHQRTFFRRNCIKAQRWTLGRFQWKRQLARLLSETHQAVALREQRAPPAVGALCLTVHHSAQPWTLKLCKFWTGEENRTKRGHNKDAKEQFRGPRSPGWSSRRKERAGRWPRKKQHDEHRTSDGSGPKAHWVPAHKRKTCNQARGTEFRSPETWSKPQKRQRGKRNHTSKTEIKEEKIKQLSLQQHWQLEVVEQRLQHLKYTLWNSVHSLQIECSQCWTFQVTAFSCIFSWEVYQRLNPPNPNMTHLKRPWCWERLRPGEGDDRGWDGWMASLTQWTWVWVNSRSWWWTGRPSMLQSMGSQRIGHD